jgi:hypothetical protein
MKDKIIFWLDSDFTHFTIAKAIQDKYDAEFFAVIDITDNPKKFFQKQQLVKFKKIWFYHDSIDPQQAPDLDYLRAFEEKYQINLWTLAFNERLFYRFNDYHKFTENEVLSILSQECKLFEQVLDEIKPDFLIMLDTNMHHNHLFYEINKKRGVKPMLLVTARLARRWTISSIADNADFSPDKTMSTSNKSFEELQNYLRTYDTFSMVYEAEKRISGTKSELIKAAVHFLFKNPNTNIKTHYSYYGRTKLKVLYKSIQNKLKTKYRGNFINHKFIKNIDEYNQFIFFPLHQDPERSLLLTVPFYTNQLEVITNIVKSLPIGYKLLIKEHPGMMNREWRPISYYKKLMSLPNVVLVHPNVKPEDLYKKCSLVIAIAGTACFEASFYQKPSILLADTSFSRLSFINRVSSMEELPTAIRTSLKKNVDLSELNEYVDILLQNTFEFDYQTYALDFAQQFFFSSLLVDVEIDEKQVEIFLQNHKPILEKLANEHIKKINQYKTMNKQ